MSYTKSNYSPRISKKTYAAVLTAKDDFSKILQLKKGLNEITAYQIAIEAISIATKYMHDFKDVDPSWKPAKASRNQKTTDNTITRNEVN